MIKYLFLVLVTLLSGCTTDFSGLDKPEESVYIRFTSHADIKADIEEASYTKRQTTRDGNTSTEQSVGILGIATHEDMMTETTFAGHDAASLRQWMANDVYHRNPSTGDITHEDGESPLFPIDKGSAIVACAYMPHTDKVIFSADDCYIPIDLMADSATTDWRYSGRNAMSKSEYREKGTFALDTLKHVMTRLDLILHSNVNRTNKKVKILEINLGIRNNGKGKLSLDNGKLTLDSDTHEPGTVHRLVRRPNLEFSLYDDLKDSIRTERYYLLPYTEIQDLRIVSVWNEQDTITYEYTIADRAQWDSSNLHPGKRSTINVRSIKYIN